MAAETSKLVVKVMVPAAWSTVPEPPAVVVSVAPNYILRADFAPLSVEVTSDLTHIASVHAVRPLM